MHYIIKLQIENTEIKLQIEIPVLFPWTSYCELWIIKSHLHRIFVMRNINLDIFITWKHPEKSSHLGHCHNIVRLFPNTFAI